MQGAHRTGDLRRSQSGRAARTAGAGLTGAVALAVLALGCPAAQAAASTPTADASAPQVLPPGEPLPPADSVDLHDGMMPAESPDAVPAADPARASTGAPVTAAPAGPAAQASASVQYGLDAARYQHPYGEAIDWRAVAASNRSFAIIKATEVSYTNPYLAQDLKGAHDAGMVVGAYTFARPQYSAVSQADAFADAIRTMPSPALPPVLDLEDDGGLTPSQLIAWTHAFLDRLQARTGTVPMIYSGPGFWADSMAGSTDFTEYPLWEAHYTTASAPRQMGGWDSYTLWQFTSSGSIPGITGAVDENRFDGTRDQLARVASSAHPIDDKHAQLGGDLGVLGPATGVETAVAGGRMRPYRNGVIYWSSRTGAHEVHGAVLTKYLAMGGPAGAFGFPLTDETVTPDKVGRYNQFAGGASVYWSPATGAHEVHGSIRVEWAASGWEQGPLGYPTTDELMPPDRTGRFNHFSKGGSVYWSPATGAHEVHGAVRALWAASGWELGPLGYPTTGELMTPDKVGRFNHFSKTASIYWTPKTGAHSVRGAIRTSWAATGWETGPAGYPVAEQVAVADGTRQDFQRAYLLQQGPSLQVSVHPK